MGCSSSVPEDVTAFPPEVPKDSETLDKGLPDQHTAHGENTEEHNTDSQDHEKVDDAVVHEEDITVVNEPPEYIYEYERYHPELGWGNSSPGHLLPSDRGKYSNEGATVFSRDDMHLLIDASMRHWELRQCEGIWEEFEYAFDFQHCDWHEKQRQNSHVRRKLKRLQLQNPDMLATATSISVGLGLVPVSKLPDETLPPKMMRGWISKEGGAVIRSFNDRYFVLESTDTASTLTYYLKKAMGDESRSEDEDIGPPYGLNERGKINLKGGVMTRSMQHTTVASAYRKQKYVLDLKTCPEGHAWIGALHEHLAFANRHDHHDLPPHQQQMFSAPSSPVPTVATAITSDDHDHDVSHSHNHSKPQSHASPSSSHLPSSPLSPSSSEPDTVLINISTAYQYIFLYERWQPLLEWGNSYPGHLLPTDKGKYSNRAATAFSQTINSVILPPLPKDWFPLTEFVSDFEGDKNHQWEYAFNFGNYKWHDYQQKNSCVRRKLLKRKIGDSHDPSNGLVPPRTLAARAAKPPPVMVRGWISKEGGAVRKSFNNRYFVLESTATSSTITYYLKKATAATATDDERTSEAADVCPPYGLHERGKIDLKGGTFTQGTAHSSVTSANGKQKYVLDLKSCSQGEAWVAALTEHVAYARHLQAITDRLLGGEDAMCSFKEMRLSQTHSVAVNK